MNGKQKLVEKIQQLKSELAKLKNKVKKYNTEKKTVNNTTQKHQSDHGDNKEVVEVTVHQDNDQCPTSSQRSSNT